ncbi:nuclear transport factor 2 family protein [Streptomyces mirabilis]|uniref:nuclear transport factor 2 family protein n=1 Tax=Streptomyces mirabilis TaxID=68239 RepID=UPI0032550EC4
MSDTQRLWNDYAACWSAEPADRVAALGAVAVDEVAYRDPGTEVGSLTELAAYMAGFAQAFPGHRFRIDEVLEHHDRSLAAGPSSAGRTRLRRPASAPPATTKTAASPTSPASSSRRSWTIDLELWTGLEAVRCPRLSGAEAQPVTGSGGGLVVHVVSPFIVP